MILGVYATLGVFPLMASREPLAHRSLIWFAVWHGLARGGRSRRAGAAAGDVPARLIVAIALAALTPAPGSHGRA